MKQYLFLITLIFISILLSILLIPNEPEGFTTYFRQSIRPHIRTFRNAQDTVTYHFNTKFKAFGRNLGFY
jgi:uncharacterized protein YxeA